MGVSLNDCNKVVRSLKAPRRANKSARKILAKKTKPQDLVYGRVPSKKKLKKMEHKKKMLEKVVEKYIEDKSEGVVAMEVDLVSEVTKYFEISSIEGGK